MGRQHAPQIVVPPPRARKTMVDVRRGSNPRRRPHAPQRKSTIAQPLRPFQRHAGCRSDFRSTRMRRRLAVRLRPRHPDPHLRCRTRRLPTSSRCAGSRCCPGSPSNFRHSRTMTGSSGWRTGRAPAITARESGSGRTAPGIGVTAQWVGRLPLPGKTPTRITADRQNLGLLSKRPSPRRSSATMTPRTGTARGNS